MKTIDYFKVGIVTMGICLNLSSCGNRNSANESTESYGVRGGRSISTEEYSRGSLSGTYRDADGIIHSSDNIFAPRKGESRNDESYQKRMKTGEYSTPKNQYNKGYEKGYEEGYNDGQISLDK